MSNKLLPCPFCGSDDVDVESESFLLSPEPERYVRCSNCGALGPWVSGEPGWRDKVRALWNQRTLPDANKRLVGEEDIRELPQPSGRFQTALWDLIAEIETRAFSKGDEELRAVADRARKTALAIGAGPPAPSGEGQTDNTQGA